ncbi:MAG: tetratricopeptide repeat protein [Alicyclobacillus macrosporangiidus]|uniref:tetratricopeptide repeat protein n=1 Tax=Alicyclobacillus macrosporangiidus TaxID=392015 RepID=UPI0026F1486B|nr:tetratricopeptide repeat protein [Alicyclobacillus macrosporangiidus]MCL6597618.1 tetratricopeptide repeat protein [Alicyclobacillus macrosporangiidus]
MPKILRVALAQIAAHAAYFARSSSLLSEPTGDDIGLDKLSSVAAIKGLRSSIFERYLRHAEQKITSIISCAVKHDAELLIFPEYSVPVELLAKVKSMAVESKVTVIAGSHMVTANFSDIYKQIGLETLLDRDTDDVAVRPDAIRKAISPVFFPDGTTVYVGKSFESQWESNLVVSEEEWNWLTVNHRKSYLLGIKICIDALKDGLPRQDSYQPRILAIPSMSPKTDFFDSPAKMYLHQEIPVCYVNEAKGGNSRIYGWCHREHRDPFLTTEGTVEIPPGDEALLIADVDLEGQFGKNSTVNQHEPLKVNALIPVLYATEPSHLDAMNILATQSAEPSRYLEIVESRNVPQVLTMKLKVLSSLLSAGLARKEDIIFLTEVLCLEHEEPLWRIQYDSLQQLQKILVSLVTTTLGDEAVEILRVVKKNLAMLSREHGELNTAQVSVDQELGSAVQRPYLGRDGAVSELRNFVNSTHFRVATVFGMRGIGKSEFLKEGVNRVLPASWKRIVVPITAGTGFNRFILSLSTQLRVHVNEEQLLKMESEENDELINTVLERFFGLQSACLLIDDWHHVFSKRGYRDNRFSRFLTLATNYTGGNNNKIILTSQVRINHSNTFTIVLKSLDEAAIRGIMDWNIRLSRGNSSPVHIPNELVERVHGNPLAATLMSQLVDKFPVQTILENTKVKERFQDRLIPMLLEHIELNEREREFAQYMSVFNTPVEMSAIAAFAGDEATDLIDSLTDYFILQFDIDSGLYIMHPLIRDYFVYSTPLNVRINYHRIAAEYYTNRVKSGDGTPTDKAEQVSHLASSMQWDKAEELQFLYIDELRPVAGRLFKAKQYDSALQYYRVLDRLKDDADTKFHLGLCYAHLENWVYADRAISEAMSLIPEAWWILSGYADVLCKKRHFVEAEKLLNEALDIMANCNVPERKYSAVYQTMGLVYERLGLDKAEEYYKLAIRTDEDSAFAHYYYAKYLYNVKGDIARALQHIALAKDIDSSLKQLHVLESRIHSLKSGDLEEIDGMEEIDDTEQLEHEHEERLV